MNSVTTELDGRNEIGRFAPGNRLARGNANNKRMSELRSTLLRTVDPEKLKIAFEKLQELAISGDLPALKLFLSYAVGLPVALVEVTGADGQPFGGGGELQGVILAALERHPEARLSVAAQLRAVRDREDGGAGEALGSIPFPLDDTFDRLDPSA